MGLCPHSIIMTCSCWVFSTIYLLFARHAKEFQLILNSSQKAAAVFEKCISPEVEEFWIAALNPSLRLVERKLLFRGTVDQCTIHPRDLIRFVCEKNASAFIICHNHPSGDAKPSTNDVRITKNIFLISRLIEIPLADHIVLGNSKYYSFADHGYFLKWQKTLRKNSTN